MMEINEKNLELVFQQASALHQSEQFGDAEQLYRHILKTYPNHPATRFNLGLIATQFGQYAESLPLFKSAYEFNPDAAQFVLSYANALLNNGYQLEAMKVIKAARQKNDMPEYKSAQRAIDEAITFSLSNPSPTPSEWEPLYTLFTEQKWPELESKARKSSVQYAKAGKVWKMLTIALQAQGKDALPAKRKAAQFLPADIELHADLAFDLLSKGLNEDAEAVLRTSVKNNQDVAQAHCNLGVFLSTMSRVLEATSCCSKAIEINPSHMQAYCGLIVLLQNAGQTDQVKELIAQAVAIKTNSADAVAMLALTLSNLGLYQLAADQYNRALEINPKHVESLINLGSALRFLGLRAEAGNCFYRAIEIQPGAAMAHHNLGVMLQEEGEYNKAIVCFKQAISLVPNYTSAWMNLGIMHLDLGLFADAFEFIKQAVNLVPSDAQAHCNLGLALLGLHRNEHALQVFQYALQINPEFAFALSNVAAIYAQQGKMDQAREAFSKALTLAPGDPRVLSHALLHLPYQAADTCFAQLEAVYARRDQYPINDRITLCLAMGSAMEHAGEFEQAFAAYEEGNRLHYQMRPFAEELNDRNVGRLISDFSEEKCKALHALAAELPKSEDKRVPVFIVGMPFSGSDQVAQTLSGHPQVLGSGALQALDNILQSNDQQLAAAFDDNPALLAALRTAGQHYLDLVWQQVPDGGFICDTMSSNFYNIGLISLMLPQAKIIHVTRAVKESGFAAYAHRFATGHHYAYDQEVLGRYIKSYQKVMQHWQQALPAGSYKDMQHEATTSEPEKAARDLLAYLGLPWDAACLKQEHKAQAAERWKPFEQHLQPLLQTLQS